METSYKEKYEQAIERLKQWDREHPCGGYVVSDRDKFIFPELAESKDEKIRKELIDAVQGLWDNDALPMPLSVKRKDEWLAWLEKQGDYANFRDKAQVGDRITKNEDGVLVNLSQLKRVAKPSEKQCGQKFEMKTAEESLGINPDTYNKIVDECIFGEQKPEENKGNIGGISSNWSVEDEEMLDSVRISINEESIAQGLRSRGDSYRIEDLITIRSKQINWLKSLKGRVKPQHKQEWSEEDEVGLGDALWAIKQARTIAKDENDMGNLWYAENWLKSLRPLNHWKPSDEQMEALKNAIHIKPFENPSDSLLWGLYEQLKKLKEE